MKKKTAILVDGAFFIKRYRSINKIRNLDPVKTANDLWEMCLKHLSQAKGEGIDFVLDPMWNPIKPHLFEHIDGLASKIKNPKINNS